MKLVIDTNAVISALIKDSVSRRIIMHGNLSFIAPDYTLQEIAKHEDYICSKSGISPENFQILLDIMFSRITILPKADYSANMDEAMELIGREDIKDIPFIACAIATSANGIWSDDEDLQKQGRVKVFRTKALMKRLRL